MYEAVWWLLQPSSLLLVLLLLAFAALQVGWTAAGRALLGLTLVALLALAFLPFEALLAEPLETRVAAPSALPGRVDGVLVLGGAVEWRVSAALTIAAGRALRNHLIALWGRSRAPAPSPSPLRGRGPG